MSNEFDLINLTVESIKDYQTCALLYDYRHRNELHEPILQRELMSLKYENTLKKLVAFFFYKKQGGVVPSLSALLNRWQKLWFPKEMSSYDIAVERHESLWGNLSSMNTKAVSSIMKFYEDFENDVNDPLLINEAYTAQLARGVHLNGTFDLVLRNAKTSEITVVKWLAKPKRPNLSTLNIDFAALKFAYEDKHAGRKLDVKYAIYDLGSPKLGYTDIEVTQDDVNGLLYWADEISRAEVFAPRRGLTSYCKKCPFDKPCSEFHITRDMLQKASSVND